jgi:hypothetical protein
LVLAKLGDFLWVVPEVRLLVVVLCEILARERKAGLRIVVVRCGRRDKGFEQPFGFEVDCVLRPGGLSTTDEKSVEVHNVGHWA